MATVSSPFQNNIENNISGSIIISAKKEFIKKNEFKKKTDSIIGPAKNRTNRTNRTV